MVWALVSLQYIVRPFGLQARPLLTVALSARLTSLPPTQQCSVAFAASRGS